MIGKKEVIFLVFFAAILANLYSVSSLQYDCEFRQLSTCNSQTGFQYIVFKASDISNAHGEISSSTNYGYGLCCNFTGLPRPSFCSSDGGDPGNYVDNRTLSLSSLTNAHAKSPQQSPLSYTEVCYRNLECVQMANCDSEYPMDAFSLSNYTNAHIGAYNEYAAYNVCCRNLKEPVIPTCPAQTCNPNDICNNPINGIPYCCESCCTPDFGAEICQDKVCGSYTNNCGQTFKCGENTRDCTVNYNECVETGTQTCNLATGQWNTECTGTTDPSMTCQDVGRVCGSWINNCGVSLYCGDCPEGESCNSDGFCEGVLPSCTILNVRWNTGTAQNGTNAQFTLDVRDCDQQVINFDVIEYDSGGTDDDVVVKKPDFLTIQGGGDRTVTGLWEAEWHDDVSMIESETNPPEYYIKAIYGGNSVSSRDSVTPFQLLEVTTTITGGMCEPIHTCADYNVTLCNEDDFCNVRCSSGVSCDNICDEGDISYNVNVNCEWNGEECVVAYGTVACGEDEDSFIPGRCVNTFDEIINCEDPNSNGFYSASWTGTWTWGTTTGNPGWTTQQECVDDISPCTELNQCKLHTDGKYYCDPYGSRDKCWAGGDILFECPAQIRLSFFGNIQFIITLLVIGIIYGLLALDRKNK